VLLKKLNCCAAKVFYFLVFGSVTLLVTFCSALLSFCQEINSAADQLANEAVALPGANLDPSDVTRCNACIIHQLF
jgi:hypothetical protein